MDQSQSEVKQNKSKLGLLATLDWLREKARVFLTNHSSEIRKTKSQKTCDT